MATFKRGHISANSRAYARVGTYFFEVIVGAHEHKVEAPPSEHAYGWKPIWLKFGMAQSKNTRWMSLTAMTEEELEAMRKVINLGIDDALMVVRDLDRKAIELMESGATEIPFRAFASAPPFYERTIPLEYEEKLMDEN